MDQTENLIDRIPEDPGNLEYLENTVANTPRQELGGQTVIQALLGAEAKAAELGDRGALPALCRAAVESMELITQELQADIRKVTVFAAGPLFKSLDPVIQGWYREALAVGDLRQLVALADITDGDTLRAVFAALRRELSPEDLGDFNALLEPGPVDPETGKAGPSIYDKAREWAGELGDPLTKIKREAMGRLILNSNLANSLPGYVDSKTGAKVPVVNNGPFNLPVLPGVTNYLNVTLDFDYYKGPRPFTETDLDVLNTVLTLIHNGYMRFSADTVHQLRFNRERREYRKEAAERDEESIKVLTHTMVYYDITEEVEKRNRGKTENGKVKINGKLITGWKAGRPLLSLGEDIAIDEEGREYTEYLVLNYPEVLSYSLATNQIITISPQLADVRRVDKKGKICESVNITEPRRVIVCYLLRRIAVMKRDRKNKKKNQKQADKILFETFYAECGVDRESKAELQRARKFALQVLDYEKAIGYIAGYTIEKQGNSYRSMIIELPAEN